METEQDKSDKKLMHANFASSEVKKEDRKPLSYKLKYFTAAAIFYGNMAFVSISNR